LGNLKQRLEGRQLSKKTKGARDTRTGVEPEGREGRVSKKKGDRRVTVSPNLGRDGTLG